MKDWHILYVKSRAEKKVTEHLAAKGFEVFCPLETTIRQWSDRKKKVLVPYFPSYVFVRFDTGDRLSVLQTSGVVALVDYLGRPAAIPDEEMQAMIRFFEDHSSSEIECTRYDAENRQEKKSVEIRQTGEKTELILQQLGMKVIAK